jgi:hypothetical protein
LLARCGLRGRTGRVGQDSDGRITLTELLQAYWEPGRFRAHLKEATEQVRALRKQLGSQRPQPDAGARQ